MELCFYMVMDVPFRIVVTRFEPERDRIYPGSHSEIRKRDQQIVEVSESNSCVPSMSKLSEGNSAHDPDMILDET